MADEVNASTLVHSVLLCQEKKTSLTSAIKQYSDMSSAKSDSVIAGFVKRTAVNEEECKKK